MKEDLFYYFNKNKAILLLMLAIYSFSLILYFINFQSVNYSATYPNNFDIIRFINSFFWCAFSFFFIKFKERKVIPYFLLLTLWTQIVPIGIVYSFSGGSALFFNIINLGFFLTVILSNLEPIKEFSLFNNLDNKSIISFFSILILILLCVILKYNGLPSMLALNIYRVYELRTSNAFVLNRYLHWFMGMAVTVVIPFILSYEVRKNTKNTLLYLIFFSLIIIILYLYTGYKFYLFSLPVTLFCIYFSYVKHFTLKLFVYFSIIMLIISLFSCMNNIFGIFFENIFSLIGRRALIVPARVVFFYDHYFEENDKYYFYGFLPQAFLPYGNPLANNEIIGKTIGLRYLKEPTNASTGHIGEAVMHFGRIGIFFSWFLYLFILKILEMLEKKIGFNVVVGAFSFFIYFLIDAPLIASLIHGSGLALIVMALIFKKERFLTN